MDHMKNAIVFFILYFKIYSPNANTKQVYRITKLLLAVKKTKIPELF